MNKIIGCISLFLGLAATILFVVLFALSFGSADYGEGGAEFWTDEDYVAFIIVSIALAFGGLYIFLKSNNPTDNTALIVGGEFTTLFMGVILTGYSFGKFFKALAKGNGFSGWYFGFGMGGLALLAAGLAIYILFGRNMKKD